MKTLNIYVFTFLMLWGTVCQAALDPAKTVKSSTDKIIQLTVDKNGRGLLVNHKKLVKLRDLMGQSLNWNVMIQRAMGRNWKKVTPAEQKRIVDLASLLIIKTYTDELSELEGRPSVQVGTFKSTSQGRAELPCVVVFKTLSVTFEYKYISAGGQWVCYDGAIEGASMVSSYRSQFDSHFRRGNGAELIAKFEKKLGL